MNIKYVITLLLATFCLYPLETKSTQKLPYKLDITGYVRNDSYLVTNTGYRLSDNNVLYICPLPPTPNKERNIFAQVSSSVTNILTAMNCLFSLQLSNDTRIDGYVESLFYSFFILSGASFLKEAFFQYADSKQSLMIGQSKHPLCIPEIIPNCVAINNGAPIVPAGKNPEILYKRKLNENVYLLLGIIGSYEYGIDGPQPDPLTYSAWYLNNGVIPMFATRLDYRTPFFEIGYGCNIMKYLPRLSTQTGINENVKIPEVAHERVWSGQMSFHCAYWQPRYTIQFQTMYGSNGAPLFQGGGYGIHTRNPVTGKQTYANTFYSASWMDLNLLGYDSPVQPGLFVGYIKNLGSKKPLFIDEKTGLPIIYSIENILSMGTSASLDNQDLNFNFIRKRTTDLLRVSPRVWMYPKEYFVIGLELNVFYGIFGEPNRYGRTNNPVSLTSLEGVLSTQFLF